MPNYAIIENGIVSNVALSDEPIADNWILSDTARIGDIWNNGEFITPPPSDFNVEKKWEQVRSIRNRFLSDCDWTQLNDAPLSDTQRQEWAVYRQALRDITLQPDPFNIVWPIEPGA